MTLYIALCDDEEIDIKAERELILSAMPNGVDCEIDEFTSSKDMLASGKTYHLIFLDVEMDGLNGIDTAELLHKRSPMTLIFFVTHHEAYMDDALNKHAFRFWTKPISKPRLLYGIKSALAEINTRVRTITVTIAKKPFKIRLKDIIYIYHKDRLTHITTTKNEMETYETFQSIAKQLTGDCFVQTHASCCVNLNYVTDYTKKDIICEYDGKIYKAYMSKRKYADFCKQFREWSGGVR